MLDRQIPGRRLGIQARVLLAMTPALALLLAVHVARAAAAPARAALPVPRSHAPVDAAGPVVLHVQGSPASFILSPADLQGPLGLTADAYGAYIPALDPAKVVPLLSAFATQVQVAPRNAAISLIKGKLVLTPDVPGAALDISAAATALAEAAGTRARTVTVALRTVPAPVSAAALAPVYRQWSTLLSQGFTLRYGDQSWKIRAGTLVGMLALQSTQGGGGSASWARGATPVLAARIAAIAAEVDTTPQDARFRLRDGQVALVAPSRDGRQVDQQASAAAAVAALDAGQVQADLVVTSLPAAYTAAPGAAINTPDLLATASTTYHGSSPERAHNVEFGTALVDGALVPPGSEFDLNATLGPLTLDAGFQMGFAIVSTGDDVTTVPAEAGGICQVATTLFQSVFWAGLPMTERNHHSYWIVSYGVAPSGLQGLDATIAPPEKNFRWRNTTGNWILIKAHAQDGVVRFGLWGTNPGWKVQVDAPVISKQVPTYSDQIYQASWALPWGVTRQVEHAQPGFSADIHRQVFDVAGTRIDDWHAEGTYLPAHNRYLIGQQGRPAPPAPPRTSGSSSAPPAKP